MARKRYGDSSSATLHKSMGSPGIYLVRMVVFLALVVLIASILSAELIISFQSNPGLNGLIIATLFFGILFAFRQVIRLYPEIRWVNAFRIADPGLAIAHRPVLLSPMATMLRDRTGVLSLSTASMRSIMDSIGSRLDEARDTGRYLVGLLVFLGLLGTFWGLLQTIQSVGLTINTLDTKANESALIFEELKSGLAAPLKGMGTAFSSSLLGLAGSLILGFLELQASHAHNRFYNELEEWLSGITELTPGGAVEGVGNEQASRQLYSAIFEMQRSVSELTDRVQASGGDGVPDSEAVRELAAGINQLVVQMREEQNVVRQWIDEQSSQSHAVLKTLETMSQRLSRRS